MCIIIFYLKILIITFATLFCPHYLINIQKDMGINLSKELS